VINTIYQDGGAYTTFRAFSPTQPEETYSMHQNTNIHLDLIFTWQIIISRITASIFE
jgi:hypothetical protein